MTKTFITFLCILMLGVWSTTFAADTSTGAATPPADESTQMAKQAAGKPGEQIPFGLETPKRASDFMGKTVKNNNNDSIGSIQDLVTDDNGTLRYAILSHGGFLGIGDKLIPIPLKALRLNPDKELVLNINKQTLEKAPSFDAKQWPNFSQPQWYTRTYTYWKVEPDAEQPATKK